MGVSGHPVDTGPKVALWRKSDQAAFGLAPGLADVTAAASVTTC